MKDQKRIALTIIYFDIFRHLMSIFVIQNLSLPILSFHRNSLQLTLLLQIQNFPPYFSFSPLWLLLSKSLLSLRLQNHPNHPQPFYKLHQCPDPTMVFCICCFARIESIFWCHLYSYQSLRTKTKRKLIFFCFSQLYNLAWIFHGIRYILFWKSLTWESSLCRKR